MLVTLLNNQRDPSNVTVVHVFLTAVHWARKHLFQTRIVDLGDGVHGVIQVGPLVHT